MRGFRRLAGAAVVFTFVLIVLGAVVRSTGSGLACPDWPRCYGLWLPTPAEIGATDYSFGQVMLELAHRVVAGFVVGPLVLALLIWAVRRRHEMRGPAPIMGVAFILVLIQAGLGGFTVLDRNSPLSVAVHLATALVFLAVLILVFLVSKRRSGLDATPEPVPPGLRAAAGLTLAAALAVVTSGAVVAKSGASLACTGWPLCAGLALPDLGDPLVRLHFGHRLLALVAAVFIGGLYLAGRARRWEAPMFHRDARAAGVLLLTEVGVGAGVIFASAPLWLAVVHQAVGILVFAALAVAFLRPFVRRQRFGHG